MRATPDEAFADLDSLTGFIRAEASMTAARKWFADIYAAIETLAEMPARCPVIPESEEIGQEVRILLHGRKNRAYRIYYAIHYETPSSGTVHVFHVRHWARQALSTDELQELMDEFIDEQGE